MPELNQKMVFQIYLDNLKNILMQPDKVNEAVEWRTIIGIISEDAKRKNVTLRDVANEFHDDGQLKKDSKIVFNELDRVKNERDLYFKGNDHLSEWEMIALQSAFFKAGQDAHTHFSSLVKNPSDSSNLQTWLLQARSLIANELHDLNFKPPIKNLEINANTIQKLESLKNDSDLLALISKYSPHVHSPSDIKLTEIASKQHGIVNKDTTQLIKDLKKICSTIKDDTHRKQIKRDLFAGILQILSDLKKSDIDRIKEASTLISTTLAKIKETKGISLLAGKNSTEKLLSDMKSKIDHYNKKYLAVVSMNNK